MSGKGGARTTPVSFQGAGWWVHPAPPGHTGRVPARDPGLQPDCKQVAPYNLHDDDGRHTPQEWQCREGQPGDHAPGCDQEQVHHALAVYRLD